MAKALGVFLLPIIFSVFSVSARAASVEKFHGAGLEKMVNGLHEIEPAVVSRVKQILDGK
jgi:hypothetical protein